MSPGRLRLPVELLEVIFEQAWTLAKGDRTYMPGHQKPLPDAPPFKALYPLWQRIKHRRRLIKSPERLMELASDIDTHANRTRFTLVLRFDNWKPTGSYSGIQAALVKMLRALRTLTFIACDFPDHDDLIVQLPRLTSLTHLDFTSCPVRSFWDEPEFSEAIGESRLTHIAFCDPSLRLEHLTFPTLRNLQLNTDVAFRGISAQECVDDSDLFETSWDVPDWSKGSNRFGGTALAYDDLERLVEVAEDHGVELTGNSVDAKEV
ncbi:hypothetical protein JCM11641_005937 [Rhodosporidiobolus odoratus]